jgi:hypothetical protein
VWISVVALRTDPSELARVFGDRWLAVLQADFRAMRAKQQHRQAALKPPIQICQTDRTGDTRLEVWTVEEWDDRLLASDNSVVEQVPAGVREYYRFEQRSGTWLAVDYAIQRSATRPSCAGRTPPAPGSAVSPSLSPSPSPSPTR